MKRQFHSTIVGRERLSDRIYRFTVTLDDSGADIRPGQFLFIKPFHGIAPLLRRPFAVLDVCDSTARFLFEVKGDGTRELACREEGHTLDIIYPLGNGFSPGRKETPVLVAGGMGIAPLFMLARYCAANGLDFSLIYGAATEKALVLRNELEAFVPSIAYCTDDGSHGHRGLVTDLVSDRGPSAVYYCCGPLPMMKAAARTVHGFGRRCMVSLEEHMACGVGVCMGCVTELRPENNVRRTARICMEGPVFDAGELAWET